MAETLVYFLGGVALGALASLSPRIRAIVKETLSHPSRDAELEINGDKVTVRPAHRQERVLTVR